MALGIGEANAFNALLRAFGIVSGEDDSPLRPVHVEAAALLLARGARKALDGCGATEDEIREGLARFFAAKRGEGQLLDDGKAVAAPLVGRLSADALAVGWGEDDDGTDVITIANTALVPSQTLVEMSPMDAIQIGAQLVLSGHEAIDNRQWGEPDNG